MPGHASGNATLVHLYKSLAATEKIEPAGAMVDTKEQREMLNHEAILTVVDCLAQQCESAALRYIITKYSIT